MSVHTQPIATRMRAEFSRKAQEGPNHGVLEPPFIMAVQLLLDRLRQE